MQVAKADVCGAYQYFGLFYMNPGRVISKMFIARTDKAGEKLFCYDFIKETWGERHRNAFYQWLDSGKHAGDLSEMTESDALWFLEMEHAFNGEGDDAAVEALLSKWREKAAPLADTWYANAGWPAKYVETTFYLQGKQYSIKPDDIGLETGNCWDEGLMEYLQGDIDEDLKKIGATEIRHYGFLD